jgi:nucleoside-diphosphate-sugar epimerase
MKVLITGATGFLGSRVVHYLLAAGASVRALVRKSSNTSALEAQTVEIVVGSLHPAEGLVDAMAGVDAVIHCAGGGWARNTQDFYDKNTATTENLLAAAAQGAPELKRFVLVSSLAAHGPSANGAPRDPTEKATPVTHYGRAKALAEEAALGYQDRFGVTIIRPPAIYGPADTRMLPLFEMASRGFVAIPSRGRSLSVIHVNDCARAICDLALKEHPTGRRYFVEDGAPMSFDALALTVGAAVGRRPRVLRIPRWVFLIAALITEAISFVLRREALLTRDKVCDLSQPHWVCDASPLRNELGWKAQFSFEEGAKSTADWYREQQWIR